MSFPRSARFEEMLNEIPNLTKDMYSNCTTFMNDVAADLKGARVKGSFLNAVTVLSSVEGTVITVNVAGFEKDEISLETDTVENTIKVVAKNEGNSLETTVRSLNEVSVDNVTAVHKNGQLVVTVSGPAAEKNVHTVKIE
jgi:HSP20 family molecular chaperone IbpA